MATKVGAHPTTGVALKTPAMTELDDGALLTAIADRRDRDAYQELYGRYARKAHALARYLCGSEADAEEAFQEGMLRVWLYAKSYRPDGNARGWILRIVARESLKKTNAGKKDERAMGHEDPTHEPALQETAVASSEREELLAGLRRGVERLAPLHRRMVLLYFAAGMTQKQIADQLAMPARTVSLRLEQALERLRTDLRQAGFAAALPLLNAEGFEAAMEGGPPPPPHSWKAIDARLSETAAESIRTGLVAAGARKTWIVAFAAFTAVAAGGWWWAAQKPEGSARSLSAGRSAAPRPADDRLDLHWDFRKRANGDLEAIQGSWSWSRVPGREHGAMMTDVPLPTVVVLPGPIPPRPLRISGHVILRQEGNWSHNAYWMAGGKQVPFRRYHTYFIRDFRSREKMMRRRPFEIYFVDQYVLVLADGDVVQVNEYPRSYPSDRVALGIKNWAVTDLSVRTLGPDEFPDGLRDPLGIIESKKMKVDPRQTWPSAEWDKYRPDGQADNAETHE